MDDICRLVADMVDLSTNQSRRRSTSLSDSMTSSTIESRQRSPQSITPGPSLVTYLMKMRTLNISGAVLSVCGLSESLRNEIGMNYGDWQLFSNLIQYLKRIEGQEPRTSCQCARSMGPLREPCV